MNENSGFDAYAMFHALKLHFTGNYDYIKYNGKTNVSKQSFSSRKDKYSFYKLSRKYQPDDLRDYYVSNFIAGEVQWVGDIIGPDGEQNYSNWQKRIQSLTYRFKSDINMLCDEEPQLDKSLIVKNGDTPTLLNYWMQGKLCIETIVILDDILNFFPMWERRIADDIIWPKYKTVCLKYRPFLEYNKQTFKQTLKEIIKEYA